MAQLIMTGIPQNRQPPWLEPPRGIELRKCPHCVKHRFLDGVFGVLVVGTIA